MWIPRYQQKQSPLNSWDFISCRISRLAVNCWGKKSDPVRLFLFGSMRLTGIINIYYLLLLQYGVCIRLPQLKWPSSTKSTYNIILRQIISASAMSVIFQTATMSVASDVLSTQMLQQAEQQTIGLFEQAAPSVVYINTFVERLDAFSMNVFEVPAGTGSGFVWDQDGHIVTNLYVCGKSLYIGVSV